MGMTLSQVCLTCGFGRCFFLLRNLRGVCLNCYSQNLVDADFAIYLASISRRRVRQRLGFHKDGMHKRTWMPLEGPRMLE